MTVNTYLCGSYLLLLALLLISGIFSEEGNYLSHYQARLIGGICDSNCLTQFGSRLPKSTKSHHAGLYRPWRCNSEICSDCSDPCKMKYTNLTACLQSCSTNQCKSSCKFLFDQIQGYATNGGLPKSQLGLSLWAPQLTCTEIKGGQVEVVLQWQITEEDGETTSLPLTFVISLKRGEREWLAIGLTYSAVLPIARLKPGQSYNFRVTAVAEDGTVDVPRETGVVTLLKESQPPKRLFVKSTSLSETGVTVLMGWESGSQPACRLRLYCLPTSCEGESTEVILEYTPNSMWTLEDLRYGCNYTVIMHAIGSSVISNQSVSLNFTTPTCLQLTHYNYTLCAPLPSRNLTWEVYNKTEDGADVWVTWLPPLHTTSANQILSYKLIWRKIPDLIRNRIDRPHQGERTVVGDVNYMFLSALHLGSRYSITLSAQSVGGWGKPIRVVLTTPAKLSDPLNVNANLAFIAVPVAFVLVFAFISIYVTVRRNQLKKDKLALKKAQDGAILNAINPFYKAHVGPGADETSALLVDDYEVDWSWFKLGSCLGEGAFGKVLRADLKDGYTLNKARPGTKTFAVKVLREYPTDEERRNLLMEIEFMKELGQHRNIVNINGCCTIGEDVGLLMDYCPLGDLRKYLRLCREEAQSTCSEKNSGREAGKAFSNYSHTSDSGISRHYIPSNTTSISSYTSEALDIKYDLSGILSQQQLLSFARQIAVGMEYISKQRFVHRDLAARNVLVCADKSIKISDFGLTRDVYQNNVYKFDSTRKIPYKWMPIETLFEHQFTTKSDVWSFGVVLWEIVTLGGFPYPGIPDTDLFRLLKDGYRMEKPSNCSPEVYQLMLACWHPQPVDRPSFSELRTKLESMLEATRAYIDLKINICEDYFVHSDSSNSNKKTKSDDEDDTDTDQGIQLSPRSSVGSAQSTGPPDPHTNTS